jgi:hypothetical protein
VRFGVLTTVNVKITVFWDITSCSLVDRYQRFGAASVSIFRVSESERRMRWEFSLAGYEKRTKYVSENLKRREFLGKQRNKWT